LSGALLMGRWRDDVDSEIKGISSDSTQKRVRQQSHCAALIKYFLIPRKKCRWAGKINSRNICENEIAIKSLRENSSINMQVASLAAAALPILMLWRGGRLEGRTNMKRSER
jgi:hypothetical protein